MVKGESERKVTKQEGTRDTHNLGYQLVFKI